MRVAVVGPVEWIEFARVERVPTAGEIVHASETWEAAAGGGAVAAVQLARLAGECTFFTALGDDARGHAAKEQLGAFGVDVEVAWRSEKQRRGFVYLDAGGERTITVMGPRCGPRAGDPLPWSELEGADAVYLTAGDPDAVHAAREARRLVATVRAIASLAPAHVEIDALVASARDEGERYRPGDLDPPPRLVARTHGAAGGMLTAPDGTSTPWEPAPLPGPAVDAYGAGDCFAAGFTYALAEGRTSRDAVAFGARCGAACMTGRGPYDGQLRTPK
jgi:ribokinase